MTDDQKYEIGIDFDESIKNRHPDTNASLEDENEGYCNICYEVLTEET